MEACELPSFDVRGPDDLQAVVSRFCTFGAVRLRSLLSKERAAELLAHINADLADEIACRTYAEQQKLTESIVQIMADMPLTIDHSLRDVIDYLSLIHI